MPETRRDETRTESRQKRIEQKKKKRKQKRAHKRNEIHVGAGELSDKGGEREREMKGRRHCWQQGWPSRGQR